MTLKNFLKWFEYSGVWVGFVLNPFHWEPDIKVITDKTEFGLVYFELNLGLVWMRLVIDDGRW
jgi:hypothetical protein